MKTSAQVKAEHFLKIAAQVKTSSIGSAILDSMGMALLGAAGGAAIGGAMEHDPYKIHDAMAQGALLGGGIGGAAPLIVKLIGNATKGEVERGFDKMMEFRNKSADDILKNRVSGMA